MRASSAKMAMLMSVLAIAHAGVPGDALDYHLDAPKPRRKPDRSKYTAQQREIAEWNDEVDRRKAAKKRARNG